MAHSTVPLFTNQSYSGRDDGAAGAYVTEGENHGKQAAKIAVDILIQGKSPVTDRNGTFFFNVRQLDRFKLILPNEISQAARFLQIPTLNNRQIYVDSKPPLCTLFTQFPEKSKTHEHSS